MIVIRLFLPILLLVQFREMICLTLMPYRMVRKAASREFEIRKSRFIAWASSVETLPEIEQAIQARRKENWKANHHCYAYILGKKQEKQKASDDGEPSGTAGVPILDVLKRRQICNVLIVVTRYFGGIKLGAGGLIRAYAHGATLALQVAGVVDQIPIDMWKLHVSYHQSGMLENKLRESPYQIRDIGYTDVVNYTIAVRQQQSSLFRQWIADLTGGQSELTKTGERYVAVPAEK
ncbi:MAG: YigZ family protein [Sporolactobacillus sp.]|jgi:uncharacterized YigZ family protein|nr:YigZ family protein [Sporolactobacillus sp.]